MVSLMCTISHPNVLKCCMARSSRRVSENRTKHVPRH
jgi:hypothetical protein